MLLIVFILMTLKLRCDEYGFECDFTLEGAKSLELLEKLRGHFEEEHGIEYPIDAVIQMIVNRGHSLDSIKK
jgi:predicted small metal-binding protein